MFESALVSYRSLARSLRLERRPAVARLRRSAALFWTLSLATVVGLSACGERVSPPAPKPISQVPAASSVATNAVPSAGTVAPGSDASAIVSSGAGSPSLERAPASSSNPAPSGEAAALSTARKVALNAQGVAQAGVTVRVKSAEIGGDATVLDVSISFANRITDSTMLALTDTYLQDDQGARLHIKRPEDNRDLTIKEGQTLDGQLVFMGRVASGARSVTLVFNDGNDSDNIVAPGLRVELPLSGS